MRSPGTVLSWGKTEIKVLGQLVGHCSHKQSGCVRGAENVLLPPPLSFLCIMTVHTLTAGCFFSIFRYRNQIRIISIMTNKSLFSSTLQVNNPKKQILSSLVVLTSSEVRLHNCGSFHRSLTPLGLIELIRMPNYRVIPALHRVQQKSSFPKWHTHIISSFSLFVLIEFWNECGGNQSDWLNNEQLQFSVLRNQLQPV